MVFERISLGKKTFEKHVVKNKKCSTTFKNVFLRTFWEKSVPYSSSLPFIIKNIIMI
jgi:hypothetical protein